MAASFDESVIYVDAVAHSGKDEHHDDGHQQDVSHAGAHDVHLRLVHLREAPDDGSHHGTHSAEREKHGAIDEIDALIERGDDDASQRGEEGGKQDGHEDVRGLCRSHLRTINHYGDRYEGKS